MKHFTKAQQDLEDRREFLLLMIVKLKQINRRKIIELEQQNNYLNKMANEISVSNNEKIEVYAFQLNKMLKGD